MEQLQREVWRRLFPSLVTILASISVMSLSGATYLPETSFGDVVSRHAPLYRHSLTPYTLLPFARHDISATASLQTCAEHHPTPQRRRRHVEPATTHPLQVGSLDIKSGSFLRPEQPRRLTDSALLQRQRATQERKQQWKRQIKLGCPEPAKQQAEAQAGEEVSAVG